MEIDRNDRTVLGLAILVATVFVTTAAGWGVPLIGDSHRWAAALIVLLALAAGALSAPGSQPRSYVLGGLVLVAFLFAVLAFATASLASLALFVVVLLLLIAASMGRHLRHQPTAPVATHPAP